MLFPEVPGTCQAPGSWLNGARWLEPEANTLVTERLVEFHEALLDRGQIRPGIDPGSALENRPPIQHRVSRYRAASGF